MRSIRLVVMVSSPVPSGDDEIKMNAEKHECSLLKVVSDVGSTPTASTILTCFVSIASSDGRCNTCFDQHPETQLHDLKQMAQQRGYR